jgi:NADH-quinone oxidoreductase subunit N
VNLHDLVSQLIIDTNGSVSAFPWSSDSSLAAFLPELVICGTILLLLLARVVKGGERLDSFWLAFLGTLAALYCAAPWSLLTAGELPPRMEIFTGMLVYDPFSVFVR